MADSQYDAFGNFIGQPRNLQTMLNDYDYGYNFATGGVNDQDQNESYKALPWNQMGLGDVSSFYSQGEMRGQDIAGGKMDKFALMDWLRERGFKLRESSEGLGSQKYTNKWWIEDAQGNQVGEAVQGSQDNKADWAKIAAIAAMAVGGAALAGGEAGAIGGSQGLMSGGLTAEQMAAISSPELMGGAFGTGAQLGTAEAGLLGSGGISQLGNIPASTTAGSSALVRPEMLTAATVPELASLGGSAAGLLSPSLLQLGGAALGALSSQDQEQKQTATREPWGPAQDWIKENIAQGQALQKKYTDQPFSPGQQQAYQNMYGLLNSYNKEMLPGLLSNANAMMTQGYDRYAPKETRSKPKFGAVNSTWNPGLLTFGG